MTGAAQRVAAAGLEPARLGKVFVVFATKGGVGKSVVATNMSVLLATRHPNRVALIDADLQFGDDAVLLGVPPQHTSAEAAAAVGTMDTGLMESFLATHEAVDAARAVRAGRTRGGRAHHGRRDDRHGADAAHDVRLRRRRHAAALRRRRARAARRGRRGAADRQPRHPEHQEPEGRDPDPRPAVGGGQQAAPRDEPGERSRAPRHQRRRTRARGQRGVPNPVRHRDSASGQPRCAGGARQAPCARCARVACARGALLNFGSGSGSRRRPRCRPSRRASAAGGDSDEEVARSCRSSTPAGRTCNGSRASTRTSQLEEVRLRVHESSSTSSVRSSPTTRSTTTSCGGSCRSEVHKALAEENVALSAAERAQLIQRGHRRHARLRPDRPLPAGPGHHRGHGERPEDRLHRAPRQDRSGPTSSSSTRTTCAARSTRSSAEVGRRIDEASPMVDARLPDGSRVNAVIHPVAIGGPYLTIRRFSKEPYTVERPHQLRFDHAAGGALPRRVRPRPAQHRGLRRYRYREDDAAQRAVVVHSRTSTASSRSRTPRSSGSCRSTSARSRRVRRTSKAQGEVKIRELVRNSLRMRPDRVIVGEARGAEALDMLQAMNTGHDGSLTTIHSNSPRDALARIETMTLMGGIELPVRAIREQMASALDLIVHLSRLRDGTSPHHERVRGARHGGRHDRHAGHLRVRLRHGGRRGGPLPRPAQEHRHPSELLGAARRRRRARSSRSCSRSSRSHGASSDCARENANMGWVTASAFIGSSASRLLIAVLVAAAAALLVVAVTVLFGRRAGQGRTAARRLRARRPAS